MFDKLRNMLGLTTWDPMNVAPPGYKEKLEAEKNNLPLTEGDTQGAMSPKAKPKSNTRPKAPPGQGVTKKKVAPVDSPDLVATSKKKRTAKNKPEPTLSAKEQATAAGEPYINILKIEVDPNDINNGAFELDWNDKFVLNLIKAGYRKKAEDTDADIVDRWFTQVCRNVVLEVYEQDQADPDTRAQMRVIKTKDIGDGRTEVS